MLSALALLALLAHASEAPRLSEVVSIPVHDGINVIPRFAPDGRAGTIIRAWRDNGNAHGHYVYLVLLPLPKGALGPDNKTGVVSVDSGKDGLRDTVAVSPFDGERVLGAVRFVRAHLNGAPATLLVRADLGDSSSGVLADHAPADISIYKLDDPGVEVGTTPDVFRLVSHLRAPGLFCNADMALATSLHLPLPADYSGGKEPSGCF